MIQAKELYLNEDLKSGLFKRFIEKGLSDDRIAAAECLAELRSLFNKGSKEAPAVWKPILRLTVLNIALELTNGDRDQTEEWMNTPLEILGNKTPLEYVGGEEQLTDLRNLVGRLKHGVFS